MTSILMRYGIRWVAGAVVLTIALVALAFGREAAAGAAAGGVLAAISFLGLTWGVSRLMDETLETGKKARAGMLLTVKLLFVAGGMYLAIVRWALSPLGITFGIGSAIFGLTVGLSRATASPEGRAAADAESKRIADELGADQADDD